MAIAPRKYWTTKLSTADGKSRFPSLPLVIPNDHDYNPATNELVPIPSENTTHIHLFIFSFSFSFIQTLNVINLSLFQKLQSSFDLFVNHQQFCLLLDLIEVEKVMFSRDYQENQMFSILVIPWMQRHLVSGWRHQFWSVTIMPFFYQIQKAQMQQLPLVKKTLVFLY